MAPRAVRGMPRPKSKPLIYLSRSCPLSRPQAFVFSRFDPHSDVFAHIKIAALILPSVHLDALLSQAGYAGLRDLGAAQVKPLQPGEPLEMDQPTVRDLGVAEVKPC